MSPLISVIIPAHNCEPYIEKAVQSVLDQSYSQLEAIVIDDGSTDDTVRRLSSFERSAKVKIVRQERQGVWRARNTGVALSKGEFIAFLDGDDYWMPEKLARQMGVFERFSEVSLVASRPVEVDENGQPLKRVFRDVAGDVYDRPIDLSEPLLMLGNPVFMSSTVMRRAVFEEAGGFPVDRNIPSLDYDLWIRLSRNHKFFLFAEPLAYYRVLRNSILHGSLEKEYGAQLGIVERHRARYTRAQYRRRVARLYSDWADSAFYDGDASGWRAWKRAISLDPLNWRCWRLGATALVKALVQTP